MSIHRNGRGSGAREREGNGGADLEPLAVAPKQACRLLGVGHTRLYQLIAAGQLESYRDGRARRIPMAGIRARIARLLAAGDGTEPPQALNRRRP